MTLLEQVRIERAIERAEDKAQAAEWRRQDRSIAKTSLFVAAGAAILTVVSSLIQAGLLPWFKGPN